MLAIGDRVILRANAPPDAEYALFELSEIELRASEPGRVREHGYQTTAGQARARLAQHGIDGAFARACAEQMQPALAEAYARGPAARRVARFFGPLELFQAETYDASAHTYKGSFLDVAALAKDLDVAGAAATIQALSLAVLLEAEADDVTVLLSTDMWTRHRKPGERTHRRPSLTIPSQLSTALGDLGRRAPNPSVGEPLARADVIAFLRARADAAPDDDTRALFASVERAITVREMPDKGPLAYSDLWAIETRLDAGDTTEIMRAIDAVERARGRTPGTTYLRARASLAVHGEPPKLIAERVAALALSMTSFPELSLLAAEAWLEAGDPRRAIPYARDLVDGAQTDEGLLMRAQRVLARAVGAAPDQHKTAADSIPAPLPPSQAPPTRQPSLTPPGGVMADALPLVPRPVTNPGIGGPIVPTRARSDAPRDTAGAAEETPQTPPSIASEPTRTRPPTRRKPESASVLPNAPPPPLELDLPPPAPLGFAPSEVGASFSLDVPSPGAAPSAPREPSVPPNDPRDGRSRPPARRRPSAVMVEERAPKGGGVFDPRAEPDSTPFEGGSRSASSSRPAPRRSAPPGVSARQDEAPRASRLPPVRAPMKSDAGESAAPRGAAESPARTSRRPPGPVSAFMAGATHPPYRVEVPAPLVARAPLFPPAIGDRDDLVEHLALPPGVGAEPLPFGALPRSLFEARVEFTRLARELGAAYRLERGIVLRADVSGIEAMQAVLLDSFPQHLVRTPAEAFEVRRCGAVFAEILARTLDAEWIDISPTELGNWSMIIPPDLRVWPFGRIVRLIDMGHRERDLVSTFLELSSRAARR